MTKWNLFLECVQMYWKWKYSHPFAITLQIELRCIQFLLIILEMSLQLDWSTPVANSIVWTWSRPVYIRSHSWRCMSEQKLHHEVQGTIRRDRIMMRSISDVTTEFLGWDGRTCQKENSLYSTSPIWALWESGQMEATPEKKSRQHAWSLQKCRWNTEHNAKDCRLMRQKCSYMTWMQSAVSGKKNRHSSSPV